MISPLFYPCLKIYETPHQPPNPSKYLNEISAAPTDEVLQTFPLSSLIIHDDIRTAITLLNKNSAPGLDGFTPTLYTSFPSLIPTFNNLHP